MVARLSNSYPIHTCVLRSNCTWTKSPKSYIICKTSTEQVFDHQNLGDPGDLHGTSYIFRIRRPPWHASVDDAQNQSLILIAIAKINSFWAPIVALSSIV